VLQRQCQRVVLLFDGDEAGQRAADRAIEVLFDSTLDVRIATMTTAAALGSPAKDPDELVKQPGGVELLQRIIASAADALDYRFLRLREAAQTLSMQAKAKLIEEEITRLVELGLSRLNPVHRQMVIKRIATLAGVGEEAVRQAIAKARPRNRATGEAQGDVHARTEIIRPVGPRETALACVLSDSALLDDLSDAQRSLLAPGLFEREEVKIIATAVDAGRNTGQTLSLQTVLSTLDEERLKQAAVNLASEVDAMTRNDPKGLRDTFSDCLKRLEGDAAKVRALQSLQVAVRRPPPTPA
jgi:DNA primase